MKKLILIVLGLFVAVGAAFSIPKELKHDHSFQKILKVYNLADQQPHITIAAVNIDIVGDSPGEMRLQEFVKPYIATTAIPAIGNNLDDLSCLARSSSALRQLNRDKRTIGPRRRL